MSETARRFGENMPALPDVADTVVGTAWDKDSSKFYDDDTGWSERGYEAGFAAGATWGAEWHAGHMAVCEFLSDLAEIVAESNACPVCDAGWVRPNTFGGMERLCNTCRGTGKRVTP